jgi:hypothetical protein
VSLAVGSNAAAAGYAGNAYGTAGAAAKSAVVADNADTASSSASSASTNVTLSDEAKAYMARTAKAAEDPAAAEDPPSVSTVTADARAWFDQQYASLGITSAMLDGKVAVDFSSQSRATLSIVANNALGQFTDDETAAAAKALQARFDDAIAPHVVIARHTGDYAGLYKAASDYLDQAGADEKATPAWQNQNQAVQQGIAAAKGNFGKAPATGNDNDPVRSLLDRTSTPAPAAASDATSPAGNARAMLDAQASRASDNGAELVFSTARTGQQVDFSDFDNRTLAIMALNTDATFSAEESSAARTELGQRSRSGILSAFDPSSGGGGALASTQALLQQYAGMSAEEKQVLGFTDDYANKVMQNYRTMSSIQNSLGSGAGLAAYL